MGVKVGILGEGGGIGPLKVLDGVTSTGQGVDYDLPVPMANFGLQVVTGSSGAVVYLNGSIASSSDAPQVTLATWDSSSDSSGDIIWATGMPVSSVVGVLQAGASSGGISAWVCATP